ncbi:hypothetical protein D6851_02500 [Altericroceibacterium spongiae]|uniref:Uncharacterized protein n=1 Tax=Altericroceibacterium spongiae TaxID=2320269 RepID=A0A420ERS0_9SPHN|nr:hypothetical protein [Altericroceibacterium spongiae]RKF23361.1 hypothetical protein D6851_02500 [Altericroceibacterium spongiae]
MVQPGTHELGLFRSEGTRKQPRDARGRFVRVHYSPARLKILETTRQMRADMGLPPSPWLEPFGKDK